MLQPLAAPARSGNDGFPPGPVCSGEELKIGQLDWQARDTRIYVRQHGAEVVQLRCHHATSRERAVRWTIHLSTRCIARKTIVAHKDRFQRRFCLTGASSPDAGDGTTIGMHSRVKRSQDSDWVCREVEVWRSTMMRGVYTTGIMQNNTIEFRSSTIFFYGGGQSRLIVSLACANGTPIDPIVGVGRIAICAVPRAWAAGNN